MHVERNRPRSDEQGGATCKVLYKLVSVIKNMIQIVEIGPQ